jgi:hypothetical protein
MDDEHTIFFHMTDPSTRAELTGSAKPGSAEARRIAAGGAMAQTRQRSTGWYGRFANAAHAANEYQLDREKQAAGLSFTGMPDITTEDQAVTESMGTIYRRWQEHLGISDAMIIRMRRRLLSAGRALAEHGIVPPGVEAPEVYRQRSGGIVLPRAADWLEATVELRKAFTEHPELVG